ncbi:MAG: hypothetical protein GXY03_02980 [Solirubrobacterales bacterium]|nr:hypothetical protein [Solirubrobacterales bacterium]
MSAVPALAWAGAAALLAGAIAAALRPRAGLALQAVGAALLGAAGAAVALGAPAVGAGFRSDLSPALGIDGLGGVFLALIAAVAAPACAAAADLLPAGRRGAAVAALTGAFVLALAAVVAARDALTLLAAWELMTLVPAIAILVARSDAAARRTIFVYLAITHIAGVGAWVALLALAEVGALGGAPLDGAAGFAVALAALVGFGAKAGLVPLHAWLPRAHPIAPAHLSALMSGAMVAVALYGLIRVLFQWTEPAPVAVAALALAGLASALGGALQAAVARELKTLLAFSTIENVGVAAVALAAALALRAAGDDGAAALALAAALLALLGHALAKGLLFLCSGAIAASAGTLALDGLGGLARRLPWTGGAFAVGALTLAAVPPLAGFVAEWATLQALLRAAGSGSPWLGLAVSAAVVTLAATAGLALLAFVKAIGLTLLGEPRSAGAATAREAPAAIRAAVGGLAVAAVALALASGPLIGALASLGPSGAPDVGLGLGLPDSGGLPVPALALWLVAATAVLAWLAARGGRAAPAPAWACGQPADPRLAWTAGGFAKLLTLTAAVALRPRRELLVETGRDGTVVGVEHRSTEARLLDGALYAPVLGAALAAAGRARRLQSGSLRAYLGYLLALVAALLAAVRIGALG